MTLARGLLFSIAIFAALASSLSVRAQSTSSSDGGRAFQQSAKQLLDESKQKAEALIGRNAAIVSLFEANLDPVKIEAAYDEAIMSIEEAIRLYDENSTLWKLFTDVDQRIEERIQNARENAAKDARWQSRVVAWEARKEKQAQLKIELQKEILTAESSLARLAQDRELVVDVIYESGVAAAQELIETSIEDFRTINTNMQTIITQLDSNLGGVRP